MPDKHQVRMDDGPEGAPSRKSDGGCRLDSVSNHATIETDEKRTQKHRCAGSKWMKCQATVMAIRNSLRKRGMVLEFQADDLHRWGAGENRCFLSAMPNHAQK